MIENEYRYNSKFREYVDSYCKARNITVEEALKHAEVRQKFLFFKEV